MHFVKNCGKDIWYNCVMQYLTPETATSLALCNKLLYKWLQNHPSVIMFTIQMKICREREEEKIQREKQREKQRLEAQETIRKRNEESLKHKKETIAKILKSKPILKEPKDAITLLKLKKKGIQFTRGYIQNYNKWNVKSEHLSNHTFKYTFRNTKKQVICSVIKKYICTGYCWGWDVCLCFHETSVNLTWFI